MIFVAILAILIAWCLAAWALGLLIGAGVRLRDQDEPKRPGPR